MHRHEQILRDAFELISGCFGLCPLSGEVQVLYRALNPVQIASGQRLPSGLDPALDFGSVDVTEYGLTMRPDIAVARIRNGNWEHFDAVVPVFSVDAEHGRAVFADAEIVFRNIRHARLALSQIMQGRRKTSECGCRPL